MNVFVIVELLDGPEEDCSFTRDPEDEWNVFAIHGIAPDVVGAARMCSTILKKGKVHIDNLQIEEVPFNTILKSSRKGVGEYFVLHGAVGMYDVDGALLCKVIDNKIISNSQSYLACT